MTMRPSGFRSNLRLEGGSIVYAANEKEMWRAEARQFAIIGEYTTPNGPADDYFWVFLKPDGSWFEASFYSDGEESFRTGLANHLAADLQHGLCNSTDYESRVLWPRELEGLPLFNFTPVDSKGVMACIGAAIGIERGSIAPSDAVATFLNSRHNEEAPP